MAAGKASKKVVVTTVDVVDVGDEKLACYIAGLINDAGTSYTESGWGLGDIGDVDSTTTATVGDAKDE